MQSEGLCLRYPEDLGLQSNISHEMAVSMLMRATHSSATTPFQWSYIDRPADGQIFLIFMSQMTFPLDGIRYQDQEQRYTIPAGSNRELEVGEIKFGFIPGHDNAASRVRKRYRLTKGGHPQLVLVHYARGQSTAILPALNQPVRSYPLRQPNEPAIFVLGPRQGQKVYPGGASPAGLPVPDRGMGPGPMGVGFGDQQAMLAHRNSTLERRNRAERERSGSMTTRPAAQPRVEDEDSADESEMISVRSLALARYRRNHEFMNAVFNQAAFETGKRLEQPELKPSYSIFKEDDLKAQIAKLESNVAALRASAVARQEARDADILADVSVEMQAEAVLI
ncbi:hypothetical protein BDW22DRAFT_1324421 [Trametopsis cervina]|nr:hypothetical protein BDW22DRAFT_1324421 [Trametopsis cervina]